MFCCCGWCGGGDQRLGRWPCLPATDCFLVSLQLVLYQYWVTGLLRMLSSRAICILAGSLVNIRRPVSKNGGLHWIKRSWNWVTMWPVNSVNRPVEISNPVDWDTCCIFHAHPAPCPGWLCDVWQLVIGVRLLRLLCSGVREQKWSDLFRCDTIGNTRQELCPASIWTCGCTAWQLTRANDKISPQWISRRILWEGQPRPQYYLNVKLSVYTSPKYKVLT